MLTAYRRHLANCPHKAKGQAYSLCPCPIWCYGTLNGDRVRQSLGTSDSARALRKIEEMEREGIERPCPAVSVAVGGFLEYCRTNRNLKASTLASYKKTLQHLCAFTAAKVSAIDAIALDAHGQGRKIAPGTWRKELETIRAFFSWCQDRGWIDKNPGRKLRMPRVEELTTKPFTGEEVTSLIDATTVIFSDDPGEADYVRRRARALVYVLLYSGLRISDVAALQRSALEGRHLTLRVLKTGVRQKVMLHEKAAAALNSLPAQNPKFFFWTGNGDIETCIKNLRRTIQRLGSIAKIHAHPHRFRDTFAVELLTNGADIRTVQQLLGHRTVTTTEKHYAHFVAAHQALLDSAASTLDFERKTAGRPLAIHPVIHRRGNA